MCGTYHASVKSALFHTRDCHRKSPHVATAPQPEGKKRPVRIAARRQREMMVILRDHLNGETAEWLDVDDVDFDQQEQQQPAHGAVMPVIDNI